MKTKLPVLTSAAAFTAMFGLLAGCADHGTGAKINNVKVAQYLEDVAPVVREALPGAKPPLRGPASKPVLDAGSNSAAPSRLADASGSYVTPVVGVSRYGAEVDEFSNGAGSARGLVGRGARGGAGGSGVMAAPQVVAVAGGARSGAAIATKSGQPVVDQNPGDAVDGEQLVAALNDTSADGRSDFNSLSPRTGTSGSASDTPPPVTSGAGLPASPPVPKPIVASAPPPTASGSDASAGTPPLVAGTDSAAGTPPPSPSSAPAPGAMSGPPAPAVSAGISSPDAPPPATIEPPLVADLGPPPAGAPTSTESPVAGRGPGSSAPPAVESTPLDVDALAPLDGEWIGAGNGGIDGANGIEGTGEGSSVAQIPTPATALLMLVGLAGMSLARRRAR